jgi:hypothetical protein
MGNVDVSGGAVTSRLAGGWAAVGRVVSDVSAAVLRCGPDN